MNRDDYRTVCEDCEWVQHTYIVELQTEGDMYCDNKQRYFRNINSCSKWDYEKEIRSSHERI